MMYLHDYFVTELLDVNRHRESKLPPDVIWSKCSYVQLQGTAAAGLRHAKKQKRESPDKLLPPQSIDPPFRMCSKPERERTTYSRLKLRPSKFLL